MPECREKDGKLLGLELLRVLAAFAVLVWHYQHFAFDGVSIVVQRDAQPFYGLLHPFYDYGWYGVQVFWSISGFIFFRRYGESVAAGTVSAWRFFVLRFSRLYPLHLVTLLLVALLQYAHITQLGHYFVYRHNDVYHFLLQLFLASHWGLQDGYSFNGPIWSISVEVLVYLVFYVSLLLCKRALPPILTGVALAIGLREAGLENAVTDCIGFFFAGGMGALLMKNFSANPAAGIVRPLAWAITIAAPVLAVLFARAPSANAVIYSMTAYAPFVLYCFAQPLRMRQDIGKLVEVAGNLTYGSYLLHFPVQLAIAWYFKSSGMTIPMYDGSLFVFYIGMSFGAAFIGYRLFEVPAQAFLRRNLIPQTARPFRV